MSKRGRSNIFRCPVCDDILERKTSTSTARHGQDYFLCRKRDNNHRQHYFRWADDIAYEYDKDSWCVSDGVEDDSASASASASSKSESSAQFTDDEEEEEDDDEEDPWEPDSHSDE